MTSDLDVLSRPITYLSWSAQATDGKAHQVSLLLDVDPVIAVNDRSQQVVMFRNQTSRLNVLSAGSRDQSLLNRTGDNLRIDWGYFRLAAPKDEGAMEVIAPHPTADFAATGKLPMSDSMGMPEAASRTVAHLAVVLNLGSVSSQPVKRHLLVAYTEGYAIQYLERNLQPYWQRKDMAVEDLLDLAEQQYSDLDAKGNAFDKELTDDLTQAGGAAALLIASANYVINEWLDRNRTPITRRNRRARPCVGGCVVAGCGCNGRCWSAPGSPSPSRRAA